MLKIKTLISAVLLMVVCGFASEVGVVNFTSCIMESKYGKNEQGQLESVKQQWSSVLEQTEKELKEVAGKLEDQTYLEGLSPDAESQLKTKYKTLSEDMSKYQNQLYQVLNQANYIFIQKMVNYITKAAEEIASSKKLTMVVNKEMCFYNKSDLDVTKQVIGVMDKNFEKDKKLSEAKPEDKKVANKTAPAKETVKAAPKPASNTASSKVAENKAPVPAKTVPSAKK
ncbi:MAG: OmpH family outer membrane protein [Parachlamydiales bacterium]|jgi:outer membrane protein